MLSPIIQCAKRTRVGRESFRCPEEATDVVIGGSRGHDARCPAHAATARRAGNATRALTRQELRRGFIDRTERKS